MNHRIWCVYTKHWRYKKQQKEEKNERKQNMNGMVSSQLPPKSQKKIPSKEKKNQD
jgi:hypothetical protein